MKKTILLAGALALVPFLAHADLIEVDIGPSNDRVSGDYIVPIDLGISSLDGRTYSFDLKFANDHFVRILSTTRKSSFIVLPWLILQGKGYADCTSNLAWTFDANGERNSRIESANFGGVIRGDESKPFRYGLGAIFPMTLDDNGTPRTDVDALDFYGVHVEFTLAEDTGFQVLGGQLLMNAGGYTEWNDRWAIGPHVPSNDSTLGLLGLGLAALGLVKKFR